MKRATIIGLFIAAVITAILVPAISGHFVRQQAEQSMARVKTVGLALRMYALDHGNKMPPTLNALVPQYIPDAKMFSNIEFLAPGADLSKLSRETVVLRLINPKRKGDQIDVRADNSSRVIKSRSDWDGSG
jgi:type II secretory pathway pseudopilin PulG